MTKGGLECLNMSADQKASWGTASQLSGPPNKPLQLGLITLEFLNWYSQF